MFKYVDEYRDSKLCLDIADKIKAITTKEFNIMEVCGGHTMSIRKNGLQTIIGPDITLLSGPGCPICVTALADIDRALYLGGKENIALCTFGDLINVPGSKRALAEIKAEGADVRTVYSAFDVLEFAKEEPDKEFVFIGIGFETTAPSVAASILGAREENINNYSVLALNKTMPEALRAVLEDERSKVDALLCPGHVSTITGTAMYEFIPKELGVGCCIAGFEPADILTAIYILAQMHEKGEPGLANAYPRAVRDEGNIKAKGIMLEVFDKADAVWRGFGVIKGSGLKIREKYRSFDAEKKFKIKTEEARENKACICGDILRGYSRPDECSLFKTACSPISPQGACMVSSEGACAAWYKYSE